MRTYQTESIAGEIFIYSGCLIKLFRPRVDINPTRYCSNRILTDSYERRSKNSTVRIIKFTV